jgi:hypothetical protein
MIKVEGIPVSVRQTKKGKNLYVIVLGSGAMVKVLTSKTIELFKGVSITAGSFIANEGQLILFVD